jgi:hypothetical protein
MTHRLTRLAATAVIVLGTALAASPATASTASPGAAAEGIFIFCETSGNYCQRDQNNLSTANNPILEAGRVFGPATESAFHYTGGSFTWNNITYELGNIIYDQHPGWCDGLSVTDENVFLEPCNGGNGTVWGEGTRNGALIFVSRAATQQDGVLELLTGANNGDYLYTDQSGAPGAIQRWTHVQG